MVSPSTRFSSPVHRKRERLPRLLERTSLTFLGIYGVAAVRRHIVCASVIPSCTDRERERPYVLTKSRTGAWLTFLLRALHEPISCINKTFVYFELVSPPRTWTDEERLPRWHGDDGRRQVVYAHSKDTKCLSVSFRHLRVTSSFVLFCPSHLLLGISPL